MKTLSFENCDSKLSVFISHLRNYFALSTYIYGN